MRVNGFGIDTRQVSSSALQEAYGCIWLGDSSVAPFWVSYGFLVRDCNILPKQDASGSFQELSREAFSRIGRVSVLAIEPCYLGSIFRPLMFSNAYGIVCSVPAAYLPASSNYPLRDPTNPLMETARPLKMEVY